MTSPTPLAAPAAGASHVGALPAFGPDGAVHHVLHQTEDVTARVLSEQAAARAERRAEGILEAMADASFALDTEFRIVAATGLSVFDRDLATDRVTANARFREMVGLPEGDAVIGAAMLGGVVHPDDRAAVEAQLAAGSTVTLSPPAAAPDER